MQPPPVIRELVASFPIKSWTCCEGPSLGSLAWIRSFCLWIFGYFQDVLKPFSQWSLHHISIFQKTQRSHLGSFQTHVHTQVCKYDVKYIIHLIRGVCVAFSGKLVTAATMQTSETRVFFHRLRSWFSNSIMTNKKFTCDPSSASFIFFFFLQSCMHCYTLGGEMLQWCTNPFFSFFLSLIFKKICALSAFTGNVKRATYYELLL